MIKQNVISAMIGMAIQALVTGTLLYFGFINASPYQQVGVGYTLIFFTILVKKFWPDK